MVEKDFDLIGIRQDDLVNGFVNREEFLSGFRGGHMLPFSPDDALRCGDKDWG